jgi:rhomboid protease GluP
LNETPGAQPDPFDPGQDKPQPDQPAREVQLSGPVTVPTVTYTILAITVIVYMLQLASLGLFGAPMRGMDWLELYGARINEAIRAGQVWRFFTPALLHGSPPHIIFNMYALLSFGSGLERQFGHARFLALYLLTAFSGNVLSFFFANDNGFSVGASTAIFGLVAAEGVFLYQNRVLFGSQFGRAIGNIIFVVVINLFFGLAASGIDNWGHIGGLLGGLIFTWFAGPLLQVEGIYPDLKLIDGREWRDVMVGAATVILIFGGLAVWGIIAPTTR